MLGVISFVCRCFKGPKRSFRLSIVCRSPFKNLDECLIPIGGTIDQPIKGNDLKHKI